MTALRLARGYTGRDKIIKFEGCYHGHVDSLLVKAGSGALTLGAPSSPGIPKAVTDDTLVLDYNDTDSLEAVFAAQGEQIAAVIVEPVAGNMNCVPPSAAFLQALRDYCDRYGVVLIFDEVMTGFRVALANFTGPFDLLLQLIGSKKMDVTEVALAAVTDEFIAYTRSLDAVGDLDEITEFLVVAATLLDLKTARLLPRGDVDDEEDLALLEARDLLFARLLQYKAFKEVSFWVAEVLQTQGRQFARPGGLEPHYAELLPEVVIHVSHQRFAELAAGALAPKSVDTVSLAHLHASTVTVREQAQVVANRLRDSGALSFRSLVADSPGRVTTVCRFLALLELFRERVVTFEQLTPLGELTIRWTGADDQTLEISDEFDTVHDGTEPDDPPSEHEDDT